MENPNPRTAPDTYMKNEAAGVGAVIGSRLLKKYVIRKLLGVGAMGHVLEVRDNETGEEFAVKCVPAQLACSEPHMRAIQKNYDLVKGVRHPHVAGLRALERDPDSGQYYVIMELVRGIDLSRWLLEQRDITPILPVETVIGIAEQIASALDEAHKTPVGTGESGNTKKFGILHRDLKPANVMVEQGQAYRAGVPFVKLVDFGLAAQIQASLHSVSLASLNKMAGTPVYMAPEQWEGRTLTRGVDQWALAVMIYEMSAGYRPFDGPTESVVMNNVKNASPVKPSTLSAAQWSALRIAFSADRRKRYRSCMALVKALAEADQRTSDSIVAQMLPMPDEFAGVNIKESESPDTFIFDPAAMAAAAAGGSAGTSIPAAGASAKAAATAPPRAVASVVKWLSLAAVVALLAGGGYMIYTTMNKPGTKIADASGGSTVPSSTTAPEPEVAKPEVKTEADAQDIATALVKVAEAKSKRNWQAMEDVLKPLKALGISDPGSRDAVDKLLAEAADETAKSDACDKKLNEAKTLLNVGKNEEAIQIFEEARNKWPESSRLDEIYRGLSQAREALAKERTAKAGQALTDALKQALAEKEKKDWKRVVELLEPALKAPEALTHPSHDAAQNLLNEAEIESQFSKKLERGEELFASERFDDAVVLYNDLLKDTKDDARKKELGALIEKAKSAGAKLQGELANAAANKK